MSTWSGAITQSTDDASQEGAETGTAALTATITEWATEAGKQAVLGFIFKNVLIPKDSTIEKIELELFSSNSPAKVNVSIYAGLEANAVTFAATEKNFTTSHTWSTKTSKNQFNEFSFAAAYNLFTCSGAGTGICKRIEECIAESGWAEGNAISIFMQNTTNKAVKAVMWDKVTGEKPAKIKITYTAPAAASMMV